MKTNDRASAPIAALRIGALWLGFGLFDAMQTVIVMHSEGMHHVWLTLFGVVTVSWLPWALATPLVLRLTRRLPGPKPDATWVMHAAACCAIGLVFAGWTTLLEIAFNPYGEAHPPAFLPLSLDKFANGVLSSIVLYAGILTVSYAVRSRARLARAETEAARLSEGLLKARLAALRRQMEPHFLFNSLNTVSGLVREERNADAVNTIAALSNFLRRMLDDANRQEVTLSEELDVVRDYLDIQKVRFAERLAIAIDVPSELRPAALPSFILQPLVENAIKHGIARRVNGGEIGITASSGDGALTVTVRNDGPSLPANWEAERPGIGIANVRVRLQSLYGHAYDMRMRNRPGGVEVSFSVPLRGSASSA